MVQDVYVHDVYVAPAGTRWVMLIPVVLVLLLFFGMALLGFVMLLSRSKRRAGVVILCALGGFVMLGVLLVVPMIAYQRTRLHRAQAEMVQARMREAEALAEAARSRAWSAGESTPAPTHDMELAPPVHEPNIEDVPSAEGPGDVSARTEYSPSTELEAPGSAQPVASADATPSTEPASAAAPAEPAAAETPPVDAAGPEAPEAEAPEAEVADPKALEPEAAVSEAVESEAVESVEAEPKVAEVEVAPATNVAPADDSHAESAPAQPMSIAQSDAEAPRAEQADVEMNPQVVLPDEKSSLSEPGPSAVATDSIFQAQPEVRDAEAPEWIGQPASLVGEVHSQVVFAGPYMTAEECYAAFSKELRKATINYVGWLASNQFSVAISPRDIERMAIEPPAMDDASQLYLQGRQYQVGYMYTLFGHVEYDAAFRDRVAIRIREHASMQRLATAGWASGGALAGLVVIYGLLRLRAGRVGS